MPFPKPCPIREHRGRKDCCGRLGRTARGPVAAPKYRMIGAGIKQFPDGHIERTPAALRRRKDELLRVGAPCEACGGIFDDYREVELGHIESKGMNGWKRDDSDGNTCLLHKGANRAQGSRPLAVYLKHFWKAEHCR